MLLIYLCGFFVSLGIFTIAEMRGMRLVLIGILFGDFDNSFVQIDEEDKKDREKYIKELVGNALVTAMSWPVWLLGLFLFSPIFLYEGIVRGAVWGTKKLRYQEVKELPEDQPEVDLEALQEMEGWTDRELRKVRKSRTMRSKSNDVETKTPSLEPNPNVLIDCV